LPVASSAHRILVVVLQDEDCRRLSGNARFTRKGAAGGAQVSRGENRATFLHGHVTDVRLRRNDVQRRNSSLQASRFVLTRDTTPGMSCVASSSKASLHVLSGGGSTRYSKLTAWSWLDLRW